MNSRYTLLKEFHMAIDRIGPLYETIGYMIMDKDTGRTQIIAPDEAITLYNLRNLQNSYLNEKGELTTLVKTTPYAFPGAIVCGIIPFYTRVEIEDNVLKYLYKKGYLSEEMTPFKMKAGKKSVVKKHDTYSVSYQWNIQDVTAAMELANWLFNQQPSFTSKRYLDFCIDSNGITLNNLKEDDVFSLWNILLFQKFDNMLHFMQFNTMLLLRAVLNRAFIEKFPQNILMFAELNKTGKIQKDKSEKIQLCGSIQNFGSISYMYIWKKTIPKILLDITNSVLSKSGIRVSQFSNSILAVGKNIEIILEQFQILDIANMIYLEDLETSNYSVSYAILELLQFFTNIELQRKYTQYINFLNDKFPDKKFNP